MGIVCNFIINGPKQIKKTNRNDTFRLEPISSGEVNEGGASNRTQVNHSSKITVKFY